jgi:AcrR family transcriptional regulator
LTPVPLLDSHGRMPRRPKTAPRRPPQQKRSAETVEVLLQASEKVFERDGFAAATTNKIAEAAGVSIGTLYHYFPTLEALIEAVVHRMWSDELAIMAAAFDPAGPLEDSVRRVVFAFAERVKTRRVLYQRWYAEAPHLGQLQTGLEMANAAVALVQGALEAHKDRVRQHNLPFAADFVVKVVLAAVRTAARDYPKELESGELAEAVSDLVIRFLLA